MALRPGLSAIVAFALALTAAHASARPVTFADVAPVLYTHCAPCHHPGGDAPFSLLTFDEVKQKSRVIADAVGTGYMPPWKPTPDSAPFLGARSLRVEDIRLITQWVTDGSLPDAAAPPPPAFSSGWLHRTPDLVVTLPSYTLRPDGPDVFRNFVVHVPGDRVRYVRAFQFRPGNRAVHHANIRIDTTRASRELDDADADAGYEGLILNSAEFPEGHFLGWTPGQAAPLASADLGWALPGGSDLVVQLHMQPTGKPEPVSPTIGFYLTDEAPRSTPVMLRLGRQRIELAAGAREQHVTDTFTLPSDVTLLAVQAHAHQRARSVLASAHLPDGSTRTLLRIADWDFRWQDEYRLARPMRLPGGTSLTIDYSYDNSDTNPRNPDRPARPVEWGWRSSDEMGDVWFQFASRSLSDRASLFAAAQQKMLTEQAVGSEVLVARTPEYVPLRNDAAVTYLELGQPDNALRHFAAVTRLTPAAATAWYNEGVALDAAGRRSEAAQRYTRAIELDPQYSQAHNNLGNALAAEGRLPDAMASYRTAIRIQPSNVEAHCSLAQALMLTGQAADASAQFEEALRLRPEWTSCALPYIWLLSAHRSPAIRRPETAVTLAEHFEMLSGGADPAVLDALAAAYASAGRFDAAVTAEESAVRLTERATPHATAQLAAMRERLARYRRRQPFIVEE